MAETGSNPGLMQHLLITIKETKMTKRELNKLEKAIANLPKLYNFKRVTDDNGKFLDFVEVYEPPLVKIVNKEWGYNAIAIITDEDGQVNDGAWEYSMDSVVDINDKMRSWAEKYGYHWQCLWNGTYGLYHE